MPVALPPVYLATLAVPVLVTLPVLVALPVLVRPNVLIERICGTDPVTNGAGADVGGVVAVADVADVVAGSRRRLPRRHTLLGRRIERQLA